MEDNLPLHRLRRNARRATTAARFAAVVTGGIAAAATAIGGVAAACAGALLWAATGDRLVCAGKKAKTAWKGGAARCGLRGRDMKARTFNIASSAEDRGRAEGAGGNGGSSGGQISWEKMNGRN